MFDQPSFPLSFDLPPKLRLDCADQFDDALASWLAAAYRALGDALLIESQAKIQPADEYDAAQETAEPQKLG